MKTTEEIINNLNDLGIKVAIYPISKVFASSKKMTDDEEDWYARFSWAVSHRDHDHKSLVHHIAAITGKVPHTYIATGVTLESHQLPEDFYDVVRALEELNPEEALRPRPIWANTPSGGKWVSVSSTPTHTQASQIPALPCPAPPSESIP